MLDSPASPSQLPLRKVLRRTLEPKQYTAFEYQAYLAEEGIACSMSRPGNCLDNAVAESFFHTLKTEWVY
jgi:putative transposase